METTTRPTADPVEMWRRMGWRSQALAAGFTPQQASRLAFWRWQASRRGETRNRHVARPPFGTVEDSVDDRRW